MIVLWSVQHCVQTQVSVMIFCTTLLKKKSNPFIVNETCIQLHSSIWKSSGNIDIYIYISYYQGEKNTAADNTLSLWHPSLSFNSPQEMKLVMNSYPDSGSLGSPHSTNSFYQTKYKKWK